MFANFFSMRFGGDAAVAAGSENPLLASKRDPGDRVP